MKALIKGGLCLALGWLASQANAQEIQWRAAKPNNPNSAVVAPNVGSPSSGPEVRPVTLLLPVPLGAAPIASPPALRPAFAPVVRAQAADDKAPTPLPTLSVSVGDPKPALPLPKDNGFTPPPPGVVGPMPSHEPNFVPGPVMGSLGLGVDGGCCPDVGCGNAWGAGSCCGDSGCCPPRGRHWVTAEYLMWWQRAQVVPPLVTSSPIGTPVAQIGVLGAGNTSVPYDSTPNRTRAGGRFGLGTWLPVCCENLGIEANYFFIGRQNTTATYAPQGAYLARPFTSVLLGANNSELVTSPFNNGSVTVNSYSQLWGLEANLRYKWGCGPGWWLDALLGYRYVNLSEGIDIRETTTVTVDTVATKTNPIGGDKGTTFVESESFHTRNTFNGAQVGVDGECQLWNRFFIGGTAKIAFGSVHSTIIIDGSTTRTLPNGVVETQRGALLALNGTNIGTYSSSRFAVLPEVAVKFGYNVTDHLRVFVGYDFLYLSSVMRPGEQIDLNVNSNFRPFTGNNNPTGPRVPTVLYRTSDYWAQGLNFGLQYRY